MECIEFGKSAVVLEIGGRFVIRASCEKTGLKDRASLLSAVEGLGKIEMFKLGSTGSSFFAALVPLSGQVKTLRAKLNRMQSPCVTS